MTTGNEIASLDMKYIMIDAVMRTLDGEIVADYLISGADPNMKFVGGRNLLHVFFSPLFMPPQSPAQSPAQSPEFSFEEFMRRKLLILRTLILAGTDINALDDNGETPLDIASRFPEWGGDIRIKEILNLLEAKHGKEVKQ